VGGPARGTVPLAAALDAVAGVDAAADVDVGAPDVATSAGMALLVSTSMA